MEFTLTDGTTDIPLAYDPSSQYGYRLKFGAKIAANEPRVQWHESDDAPQKLMNLVDGNRNGFFSLFVDGSGDPDNVADDLIILRRWIDGEAQQAARAEIVGDVPSIFLKIQLDSTATYHRVLYGFIDDSESFYDEESLINQIAENVVVYLSFSPYGQAESYTSLQNYLRNANFDFESSTSGLPSYWAKSGAPTVSLDTSVKLFGIQSVSVVAGAAGLGINSSSTILATATTVCGYAWIRLVSGSAQVSIRNFTTASWVDQQSLSSDGTGSDMSRVDADGNTWYRVSPSGTVAVNDSIGLYVISYNGAATFNANGSYLTFGTVTPPDAWCSYYSIYGRGDQTTSNPDRINTFDIWGVPGDAPAAMKLTVTPSALRTVNISMWRDGRVSSSNMKHWYETITVSATTGSVTTPSDASRSGGSYYRVTIAADGLITCELSLSAEFYREVARQACNIFAIARSSAVSKATFQSPLDNQQALLQTNDTWEMLRVYSSAPADVNEDSAATSFLAFDIDVVTGTSMTVDIDAIAIQFINQNFIAVMGNTAYLIDGMTQRMFVATSARPTAHLGSLWRVIPGNVLNRFMFLGWDPDTSAHTLTDTYQVTAKLLPQTRHLLGTI